MTQTTFGLKQTYRFQTAIYLLIVVVAVGTITGLTLRFGVRTALQNEIDSMLLEDAEELALVLQGSDRKVTPTLAREWNRRAAVHELHRWFLRVLRQDGTLEWESLTVPHPAPPSYAIGTNHLLTWNNFRMIQRDITDSAKDQTTTSIQVGSSLETFDQDMILLDRLLIVTLLALVFVGPMSAWWLSGKLLQPLAILTDVTEKMQNESTLLLPIRGSGDELDRLAITINQLMNHVRQQIQQSENMLANSAHQLRSPLAAISANVEVVLNRLEEGTSRQMLESVIDECGHLRSLVNQLLLLSEAEADQWRKNRTTVDLCKLVTQACEIFDALAAERNISLEQMPCSTSLVNGNPQYLRHVIRNLIDNAIKYSPDRTLVHINLHCDETRSVCIFSVQDHGIGISEQDLPHVTDRFYRVESGRNPNITTRGSGLGLAICNAIVVGHEGKMMIESKLGKGTLVRVELPLLDSKQRITLLEDSLPPVQ